MKFRNIRILYVIILVTTTSFYVNGQADMSTYLDSIKSDLEIRWPDNEMIRIVFHGHSVPAGYFKSGVVKSLKSSPYLTLKKLNEIYPYAVISPAVTAIGGEQSEQGAKRFEREVLALEPDLIFIDYSLNDRRLGLEKAEEAWKFMIEKALDQDIKVVLLTPTPDLNEDISESDTALALHSEQVRRLAKHYEIGLVDSYAVFKQIANTQSLTGYMSQNNHPNGLGHDVVANEIIQWFLTK